MGLSEELQKYLGRIQNINEYGYKFRDQVSEEDGEDTPLDGGDQGLDDLDIPSGDGEGTGDPIDVDGGDEFNAGDSEVEDMGDQPVGDDLGGDEPVDDTQEIDVTELVDTNKDIQNRIGSLEQMQQSTSDLIQKINGTMDELVSAYTNMSGQLRKIDDIQLSMKKMEPPTEQERQEAMAQTSYPFKTTLPSYDSEQKETQTDLEGEKNGSRVLTKKDIMHNYNELDIAKSFDV